ncbi:MAG: patatin-like phospholipase family protein, partial [Acidobacteriota bacterium]
GFLTGQAILDTFGPLLGEKRTFRHLTIPCRAVATDIETGERVSIGTGRLDEAFRASCAVPVVMTPVRRDHRVLVDGGVCDPVPADVVRDMGADLTIAVNVVPPLKKGVEMLPSRLYRRLSFFNPMAYVGQSLDLPNLFDIVMSSMQTLQYELGNYRAISADIRIHPDLSDFTWVEFYRAQELIAQGAEAARRAVPAIQRALGR